ncbi:MAG: hypothetical protein A2735_01300 [Candidatus Yanofskybacteria bacterium RIFCSPHIGHO2_01_FULL_41_21]|uniref:Uncharacterized protein n=1 Tax=Candidatus Yanofskybacteria bacterium RIFCSPHIGHO2_01_FULL_41_21 TaxID=1802660 RepID=A0A1F8EA78_9BACT|nr:MAG: hypothetical protein A2735_01300 [Candidatus Yanofskybacteria bacterium RIFCSPHIGHO2_01_FULL_41_21]
MTAVSSPSHVQRYLFDWSVFSNPVVVLNIVLICLAVVTFSYYIAGVNAVTSGKYRVSTERNKIIQLTETQSMLTLEKSTTEDPVAAMAFAKDKHLVEAKDIVYVFENNNVALQR